MLGAADWPRPRLAGRRWVRRALRVVETASGPRLVELGGLSPAGWVLPGWLDGPQVWEPERGVLWRCDPLSGAVRAWPAGDAASPWADPLRAATLALAGELGAPLPATYAWAALDAALLAGDTVRAGALGALEWAPAAGLPAGLVALGRAYASEAEPPWYWEYAWGDGFAAGRLARAALEWAIAWHGDPLAQAHLGYLLAAEGDWESAAAHWATAADGPEADGCWAGLAQAAERAGDAAAAAAAWRQVEG